MMRAEDFFQPVQGRSGTMQASVVQKIDDIVSGAKIEKKKNRVRKALQCRSQSATKKADPVKAAQILDAQRGLIRSTSGWWDCVPEETQEMLLDALAGLHLGTVTQGEYRAAFDAIKKQALGPVRPAPPRHTTPVWGWPPSGGW
jgi:hypothetical protein